MQHVVAGVLYLNTRERIHLYGSKVVYIHVHIRREATSKGRGSKSAVGIWRVFRTESVCVVGW